MSNFVTLPLVLLLVASSAQAAEAVRESHQVRVGANLETWQLRWLEKPEWICTPPDPETNTCPCSGFQNGQKGSVALVRLRKGKEIERLDLTPFFGGDYTVTQDGAVLPYKAVLDGDDRRIDDPALPAEIAKRKTVQVMKLGDYTRQGQATQFALQTDTQPCGKHYGVVFGVTPDKPALHAIGSVSKPGEPLFLPMPLWEQLRDFPGPQTQITWRCGDHFSDVENELEIDPSPQGLRVKAREYECDDDGNRGKLVSETDG